MPKKFKSDKGLFEFVRAKGVGLVHAQGYFWFRDTLMPALEKAAVNEGGLGKLLADCYYVAGDVHDFNEAPQAAIKCYEQALKFDPDCGASHREIASMFGRMGKYDEALEHSDKAIALDPDDKFAIGDRPEFLKENRFYPPLFEKGDPNWFAHEYLAAFDPQAAYETIRLRRGLQAQRTKIHCYGAMQETDTYLKAWKKLTTKMDEIEFTHADWFFMENEVYSKPDLWKILLSSKAKFSGVFTTFDGLDESEQYRALSAHEKIHLRLEYFVVAQSGDFAGLRKLNKLFPEWKELAESLDR